jgi:hypothetical protein
MSFVPARMASMTPDYLAPDYYKRARFRIELDEIDRRVRAAQHPHTAWLYATQREQEEKEARSRAAIAKMEQRLRAKLAKRLAATATSGKGWRLLAAPRVSHAELDQHVRNTWDLAFHGVPWPAGWRARWADLRAANARGMCVHESKLILLDEAAQRGRTPREFLTTIVHELSHLVHPDEIHGPGHADTLERLVDFVLGSPDAVGAAASHPEPRKGILFGGRPAPLPDWEYRG